jgi:LysM repeat protein
MKSKMKRWMVTALHIAVPSVFLLLQGCTTGNAPVSWLNWPYSTPKDRYAEPVVFPGEGYGEPMTEPSPVILPPEPVVTEPPAYTIPEDSTVYTVKKGDTLSAIASMYGTSWKKLATFNNLSNPNRLVVGQEIRIPASLGSPKPVSRPSSPPASSGSSAPGSSIKQGTSYVIQRGDTLSGIATRSGVTVAELRAANGISGSRIIAGKSLTIPKDGAVNVSRTSSKPKPGPGSSAPAPAPMVDVELSDSLVAEAAPVAEAATAPVYEHVLYPGETLDDVARQYGSSKSEIMTLNRISDEASVKPGTKLLVPIPE